MILVIMDAPTVRIYASISFVCELDAEWVAADASEVGGSGRRKSKGFPVGP